MVTRIWVSVVAVFTLVVGVIAFTPPPAATALSPGLDFSADDLPTWQTNGVVRGMASSKGKVVVVGDFTQVRPGAGQSGSARTMNGLVILDAATGAPSTCQLPLSGGTARAYAATTSPDGNTVFVGGNFGSIGGVNRSRMAEIDVDSCTVRPFQVSSISSIVYSVAVSSDAVYFGGLFQSVAGQQRQGFAKVSRTGALDNDWVANAIGNMEVRPQPGVECRTTADANTAGYALQLSPDGSRIVLGGAFYTVNGTNSHSIAVVDSGTGAVVRAYPANPLNWGASSNFIHPCSVTKAIVSDGNAFYIGNEGSGGGVFDGAAKISWSTLNQEWRDTCLGAVQALEVKNDILYQAHHHHDCASMGMYPDGLRIYLSATNVNDPTQKQLGWNPALNDGTGEGIGPRAFTTASAGSNEFLFVGGEFTRVNGVLQQGITRFGTTDTGNPPTPNIVVRAVTPNALQITARSVVDNDDSPLFYQLYRNNVAWGDPVAVESAWWYRPQVTFVDKDLTPGVNYTYRVRAIDAAGNQSALSGAVTASASATASSYAATVVADEPTFYWRYDDSGGIVYDRSGNTPSGRNGLVVGGLTTTGGAIPGDPSSALSFDGATQYLWSDQIAPGPTTYSIETWFKTSSTTGGVLVGYGNGRPRTDTGATVFSSSYDRMLYMENGTGRLRFGAYDGAVRTLRTAQAYNDDQWHHVVATQGPQGMRLYVDGVEVGRNTVTGNQTYFGSWKVGADNLNSWPDNGGNNNAATRYYDGLLDETAVYPRALSHSQAIQHFRAGGGAFEVNEEPADAYGAAVYNDNPLFFWRFDEAGGNVANDSTFIGRNTGTVGSAVTRVTENLQFTGGALRTPGTNNNGNGIVAGASSSALGAYSLEFWVNTTSTAGGKIIGFENSATASGSAYDKHVYMLNNGRVRFGTYNGSPQTVTSTSSLNDGRWHHVVATQDATGMKIYVDGALQGQNGITNSETGDGFWRVGGGNLNSWPDRPSSDYFAGSIDEVAVYGSGISASTVQAHYVTGLQDTTAPSVPTALAQSGSGASLTWGASTDANGVAGYRVYRGTTADFAADASALVGNVTVPGFTDADQAPGVRFYRVAAYDIAGNESAATAAVEVTVADVTPPTQATALTASVAGTDVLLEWNASSDDVGVDYYAIYRGTTAGFSVTGLTPLAYTGTATYLDSDVEEGQWYYRVVAVDAAGNESEPSASAGALVDIDTDAPTAPADLAAVVSAAGVVTLTWSASTDDVGVAGYRVFRGEAEDFTVDEDSLVADGVAALTWSDEDTAIGTRFYKVVAYDLAANVSDPSTAVEATVEDELAPTTPSGVEATSSNGEVTVTWTASTDNIGVEDYLVYRGTTAGFTMNASSLVDEVTGTSLTDEPGEGQFFYRVVARDAAGNTSAASAAASVTVTLPDTVAPTVPGDLTANLAGDDVQLAWAASTDAVGVTGYNVYRGTTAGFSTTAGSKIGESTTVGYTDNNRPAGTWYYKVTAVDAAGNESDAASTSIEIVPAVEPVEITVAITDDSMTAQSVPTQLYGTTNQLSSRLTSGTIQSFLRLELPAAPAGTQLTGATLNVRTSGDATAHSNDAHQFHLVTGTWNEATINWNNRPTTVASDIVGTLTGATALNAPYTVALDPAILRTELGTSVTLRMAGTGADNVRLWSAEAAAVSYRPTLTLQFTPITGEPDPEPEPEPEPETDTQAPSVPSGLATTTPSATSVGVTWTASTDNVAVTGYSVHRGTSAGFTANEASRIATVTETSYTDTGLEPGTYFYKVIARDAAGNASAASAAASATLTAAEPEPEPEPDPVVQTLGASADTMVASNNAAATYGSSNQLSSRGTSGTLQSFLAFELPAAPAGMQLTGASLVVRTSNDVTANSADTHDFVIMSQSFNEATMTWNNRITQTASGVIGQLGPTPSLNAPYTVTLDAAELAAYAGQTVTLRMATSVGNDNVRIFSREATQASLRPVLTLTYTAAP